MRRPACLVKEDRNLNVLIVNKKERYAIPARLSSEESRIRAKSTKYLKNILTKFQCVVLTYSSKPLSIQYVRSLALIRAEHPPLIE